MSEKKARVWLYIGKHIDIDRHVSYMLDGPDLGALKISLVELSTLTECEARLEEINTTNRLKQMTIQELQRQCDDLRSKLEAADKENQLLEMTCTMRERDVERLKEHLENQKINSDEEYRKLDHLHLLTVAERERLREQLKWNLQNNDEFGCEFLGITIVREENKRLKEELDSALTAASIHADEHRKARAQLEACELELSATKQAVATMSQRCGEMEATSRGCVGAMMTAAQDVADLGDDNEALEAKLDKAMAAIKVTLDALKNECCCTGERSYIEPYELINCDSCDVIAKISGDFPELTNV